MALLIALPLRALVLYGVMNWRATRDWQGLWKWLGALPKIAVLGNVLFIVVGVTMDSTSHNLWPFELLVTGTVAMGFLGAVALLKRWLRVA